MLVDGLHDDGARPDRIRRGVRTPSCVEDQIRAEASALVVGIDREIPEQDDRYRFVHIATDAGGTTPSRL